MVRDDNRYIQRVDTSALDAEIKDLKRQVKWHQDRRGNPDGTRAYKRLQELLELKKEVRNGS